MSDDETKLNPYCSFEDVKRISRVSPKKLGLDKEEKPDEKLVEIIEEWILQATALINDYTRNPIDAENVDINKEFLYKNISSRIVANMCAVSAAYKSHSYIKVNDWTIRSVPSNIFPDEMKEELDNYKEDVTSDAKDFGIIAVTGREEIK